MPHTRRLRKGLAALAVVVVALCVFAADQYQGRVKESRHDSSLGDVESIVVTEAWSRPALENSTGGAYMTIRNAGAAPIRVTSASSVDANAVELHESTEHSGMVHMQMMPSLEVAPGASMTFRPGGLHYMLIGLHRKLADGDTVRMVLRVESALQSTAATAGTSNARDITVLVPVRVP